MNLIWYKYLNGILDTWRRFGWLFLDSAIVEDEVFATTVVPEEDVVIEDLASTLAPVVISLFSVVCGVF